MPRLNVLNPHSAKEKIKEIFLKRIILAKGIKKIETEIDKSADTGCGVASLGTVVQGYLMNQAWAKSYCLISAAPPPMSIRCPSEYHQKQCYRQRFGRTVCQTHRGRRSRHALLAMGILSVLSKEEQERINRTFGIDIAKECEYHHEHVEDLPKTEKEDEIEKILAGVCADKRWNATAENGRSIYSARYDVLPDRKRLKRNKIYHRTGAVVINSADPGYILSKMTNHEFNRMELRPLHPNT